MFFFVLFENEQIKINKKLLFFDQIFYFKLSTLKKQKQKQTKIMMK